MHSSRLWRVSLIVAISIARISMGLYTSLFGPTLLYLAGNVDSSISQISAMFTGRSLGSLFGAILAGVVKDNVGPNFRQLLVLGAGVGVLGLTDLVTPWITEFWLLIIVVTIGGIMFGYEDAGLQAVILRLWGERASRAQIQIYHFTYSVGAFIAPFIASPFLAKADEASSSDDSCPNSDSDVTTTPATHNQSSTTAAPPPEFNPTGWAFVIGASIMFLGSILLLILAACNVEEKVQKSVKSDGYVPEARPEEPLRAVLVFFLLVIGYYYCSVSSENMYFNFIYSITICSDLQFSVKQASTITSVFWLGLGLGRLTGVILAKFVTPKKIIIFSIAGTIIDMTLMVILGESTAWVTWLVTLCHGYTTALLYPSGVSWISQITNISGKYMYVCNIGNALGSMIMLYLAGYFFDYVDPFSVMYLTLGVSVLNALIYALLVYVGNRKLKRAVQVKPYDEDKQSRSSSYTLDNDDSEKPNFTFTPL